MPQKLKFNSLDEAIQKLFDRTGQLSQRVFTLEKKERAARHALFITLAYLSANSTVDLKLLHEIVSNGLARLDASGLPDPGAQFIEDFKAAVLECFPTADDQDPPPPKFEVIEGGKS